jgi:hypothetical protein
MARIRVLSWNIEVYGPTKFGLTPNNLSVARFVSQTIQESQANLVVLMELNSGVAKQIATTLELDLEAATGQSWDNSVTMTRPTGDVESYAMLWRTEPAMSFQPIPGAANLSPLEFPNNFSATHGRRAAYAVFHTTDTAQNFALGIYHAPPNDQAVLGVQQLASTAQLYGINGARNVDRRLLCGDYNMDAVNDAQHFAPLTALPTAPPLPPAPPPLAAGVGSGCLPAIAGGALDQSTILGKIADALQAWGPYVAHWAANSTGYRRANMAIDNVYYRAALNSANVIDCIDLIRNPRPGSQLRAIANSFVLACADGSPAFPNAQNFPPAMNLALNYMGYAFLLYRYAISDHLPVLVDVTI